MQQAFQASGRQTTAQNASFNVLVRSWPQCGVRLPDRCAGTEQHPVWRRKRLKTQMLQRCLDEVAASLLESSAEKRHKSPGMSEGTKPTGPVEGLLFQDESMPAKDRF